jgi:hypothetical protein
MVITLTIAVAGVMGTSLALAEGQQPVQQLDTAPGPSHETIFGTVSKIEGEVYTVQQPAANDYVANGMKADEVRVYVSKETKKLGGEKKVGDRIRAEVTRGGFANSIQ